MATTVNVHEAKTHLSRLLEQVEHGETVIIARAGRPIAEVKAYVPRKLVLGDLAGVRTPSDEEWAASERAVKSEWDRWLDEPIEPA